jgi:hypothetical protein
MNSRALPALGLAFALPAFAMAPDRAVPSPFEIVLAQLPASDVTEADVERLFAGVDRARGYNDLVTVLTQHERALVSQRLLDSIDRQLRNSSLNENQRGALRLARQTALDGRELGPQGAAQLLSVRLIAGSALAADTPQQFAATLTTFSEFAPVISAVLVRAALDTPGNTWPKPLFSLMEQLAADWPRLGAVAAATRLAETANRAQGSPQTSAPAPARGANDPALVGHWRTTRIVFESSRDDHLVLRVDGTAERWSVTASSTDPKTVGRWAVAGSVLNLTWPGQAQTSQAFTMYQGQLVLPNVPNRRVFWDRLDR